MSAPTPGTRGQIRVGIGGWTFEPWRNSFYPAGLPQAKELQHASRQLRTIEINGTFRRTPAESSWKSWAAQVPEGFVFSVKAPMSASQKGVLAEAGPAIERFFGSGIEALGPALGPIFWQLNARKKFDAADLEAFLGMLPREVQGLPLRHAVEARHDSFADPAWVALARSHGVALVWLDEDGGKSTPAEITADFVYLRIARADESLPQGLSPEAVDGVAASLDALARGGHPPAGMARLQGVPDAEPKPRDVYAYVIREGKPKAPQAAMAIQQAVHALSR